MIVWLLLSTTINCFAQNAGPVAGGVVSSKEWKVHRGAQKEEEFSGNVRYRNEANTFSSDWALYQHASDIWNARGHVQAEHRMESGDLLQARGDKGYFNRKSESGNMTAKNGVDFTRIAVKGGPDYGHSGRLEWEGREKISLIDHVRTWGPRMESWSDRADYSDSAQQITLTGGRPVAHKIEGEWTGAVKGDVIKAWKLARRMQADGKTKGWIEFPQNKGKQK